MKTTKTTVVTVLLESREDAQLVGLAAARMALRHANEVGDELARASFRATAIEVWFNTAQPGTKPLPGGTELKVSAAGWEVLEPAIAELVK